MSVLEHRIPPPFVVLIIGLLMWVAARHTSHMSVIDTWRLPLAAILFALGLVVVFSGFVTFGRAKTTIDPVNLEAASVLVTTGIFRISRNPMYVGFTSILFAWSIFLTAPWTLIGPATFILFIHRFQILPEERVMCAKFGRPYEEYQQQVRRWL